MRIWEYRQSLKEDCQISRPLFAFKRPIRAVLLDVDGTLYHQSSLRIFMALELCTQPLAKMSLRSAFATWRALSCFRRTREELRGLGETEGSLARLQYVEAAKQIGVEPAAMECVVAEWLYQRPLKYLRYCRRRGIEAFFSFLEHHDVRIGVFSDYPVSAKLETLGLSARISVMLWATAPEINAFKPHPKGLLRACAMWRLHPEEVLYVGDRPEVDAVAAATAGMPCAILARRRSVRVQTDLARHYVAVSSFAALQHTLARSY